MKAGMAIVAAGMLAGLISLPGAASAAPLGLSQSVVPTDGMRIDVRAKRTGVVKRTRGMRKIPKKKGL